MLVFVAAMGMFMLDRVDIALGVQLGYFVNVGLTLFAPLVLLVVWSWGGHTIRPIQIVYFIFAGLVVFVSGAAFVWDGLVPMWTAYSLLTFLGASFCFVCAVGLSEKQAEFMWRALRFLALGTAVLSCMSVFFVAIIASYLGWSTWWGFRSLSPVGGAIAVGAVLVLFVPSFVGRVVDAPSMRRVLELFVLYAGILFTGSRVIVVVSILFSVTVVIYNLIATRSSNGLLKSLSIGVIAIGVVVALFPVIEKQAAYQRMVNMEMRSSQGDQLRFLSAERATRLVSESPMLGHVPGHTYPWFRSGTVDEPNKRVFHTDYGLSLFEPHNTYLMIAVDYGIIVLVFFMVLVACVLKMFADGAVRGGKHNVYNMLGLLAFLAQALASSHILVNNRVAIVFWLTLGTWVALAQRKYTA
jgi:hypothetical protein